MLEYVSLAENHYGVRFIQVSPTEYRSLDGCPFCKDGGRGGDGDRFRLFLTGRTSPRVWCRQCGTVQFLDSLEKKAFSDEELAELREKMMQRREEREQQQKITLQLMMESTEYLEYHQALTPDAIRYWNTEGINGDSIARYKLGYCHRCPTAPYSASYTVPVLYHNTPYNIRHRLASPNGGGKYRPHMPHLPSMIFNADNLDLKSSFGLLLEGEKKSIVVTQETGIPSVAIMGNSAFNPSWTKKFDNWGLVYVCLDPDTDTIQKMVSAEEKAIWITSAFNGRGRLVTMPVKADDFFVKHGGSRYDFMKFVSMARPV